MSIHMKGSNEKWYELMKFDVCGVKTASWRFRVKKKTAAEDRTFILKDPFDDVIVDRLAFVLQPFFSRFLGCIFELWRSSILIGQFHRSHEAMMSAEALLLHIRCYVDLVVSRSTTTRSSWGWKLARGLFIYYGFLCWRHERDSIWSGLTWIEIWRKHTQNVRLMPILFATSRVILYSHTLVDYDTS